MDGSPDKVLYFGQIQYVHSDVLTGHFCPLAHCYLVKHRKTNLINICCHSEVMKAGIIT